jgi:hypothetical protein
VTVGEVEQALGRLRERLAAFDGHPGARLARDQQSLTGESRVLWQQAERGVAHARTVFEHPADVHGDRLADIRRAAELVARAIRVANQLEAARTDQLERARAIETEAAGAGDRQLAARAGGLARLIATDPLSVPMRTVEDLERDAADTALRAARARLAGLREIANATALSGDLAASRIAGFTVPLLPDIDSLATELAAIALSSQGHTARLAQWREAASLAESQVSEARAWADGIMARRDELRGLLSSLVEKAARRGRREEREIERLFQLADRDLWTAPSDLVAAEARLLELNTLLDQPAEKDQT